MLENEDLAPLIDQEALAEFRARALNPMNPVARGMAENPDHFFQHRESCNNYYEAVPVYRRGIHERDFQKSQAASTVCSITTVQKMQNA